MDGRAAINHNIEALKRILADLLAMAGLASRAAFTSPLWGGRREASGGGCDASNTPTRRSDDRRPPLKGEVKPTLPRHLRLAILRLLRPAESAARRLVIASASGLVVPLPPARKPRPKPATTEPLLRRFGIAVVMSPADLSAVARRAKAEGDGGGVGPQPSAVRVPAFPLFDPPRRPLSSGDRRTVPAHAAPRILFPGATQPFSLPPPPSPDDPIDAARLNLRLAALAAALDDLPGQAKRFARWKARHDAARKGSAPGRIRRISPLRSGRPPGGRLTRFDPSASHPRNIREVDEILAHAHALALYALEHPDTS